MASEIKELLFQEVQTIVDANTAVLLIDPVGLKADESLKLRRDLHQIGAVLKVCKANLVRRAVPENVSKTLQGSGSLGLVAGPDIAAAAKLVRELAKENKVTVRAAMVEGSAFDAESALRLADLPSRQQLYGMLVNVLAAPIIGLARVIKEVPTSLARAVQAIHDQKKGG